MSQYVEEKENILRGTGGNPRQVMEAVASRYMDANPRQGHRFRVYPADGAGMDSRGGYRFEMERWYGAAPVGAVACAWGKVWSNVGSVLPLSVRCHGPLSISVNGLNVFRSWHQLETVHELESIIQVRLEAGWNHFVLTFERTRIGFGGVVGAAHPKWVPFHVLAPTPERAGQGGWITAGPFAGEEELQPLLERLAQAAAPQEPAALLSEAATGWRWLPEQADGPKPPGPPQQGRHPDQLGRMYGLPAGESAYGWSRWDGTSGSYELAGSFSGAASVYVDGSLAGEASGGECRIAFHADGGGAHNLLIRSICPDQGEWGFSAVLRTAEGERITLRLPHPVEGAGAAAWLYAGPFPLGEKLEPAGLTTLYGMPEWAGRQTYWRLDKPGQHIRVFAENPQYGRWSYPLGVTLYGLLEAGRTLERPDWIDYVRGHMVECTAMYGYSMWDAARYGIPAVNHLLAGMDMLDDCGSQGSALLEAMKEGPIPGAEEVVRRIGDYMSQEQERLQDGAFYRNPPEIPFNRNTLWADDLYMSTLFLIRYWRHSGDTAYLEDAVLQFRRYREYLLIPGQKVMSHVYLVSRQTANGIPWGRGNGWTVFSLSELLAVLPEEHPARMELLALYRQQCEGYLGLQGKNGLWHNLLTDPESFEETSCTAMFIYAFARGIRSGWLPEPDLYLASVRKAWKGICGRAVDAAGNLYGVCQGSGYSFSARYYKNGLRPVKNDTHGIGIVLLAGVELLRLDKWMNEGDITVNEQGRADERAAGG